MTGTRESARRYITMSKRILALVFLYALVASCAVALTPAEIGV